jgi:hypothetical protein
MRIFLSSTCYESQDLRAVLEDHLIRLKHTPVLSDRIDFPVKVRVHRHDVCLDAIKQSDLVIIVIEPRYGAPYYRDRSISITWAEFNVAAENDIPMVCFIRTPIFDERLTWIRNDKKLIPAHCDSVRIFDFINHIQSHPNGYWIDTHFNTVTDIIRRIESLGGIEEIINSSLKDKAIVKFELSDLSPRTFRYLESILNKEVSLENISKIDIERALGFLPSEKGFINIYMDFELSPKIHEDALDYQIPIRPADNEGDSWLCETRLSPMGFKVKRELELALTCF